MSDEEKRSPRPGPEIENFRLVGNDDKVAVAVGRDTADDETMFLIRLDVLNTSILLGPRNAVLVGRALVEAGGAVLAAEGSLSLSLN